MIAHDSRCCATCERLARQASDATLAATLDVDARLESGWNDVAARMDRWESAGYAGHWTDAEYDEVAS